MELLFCKLLCKLGLKISLRLHRAQLMGIVSHEHGIGFSLQILLTDDVSQAERRS